jgi:hypothetical protein
VKDGKFVRVDASGKEFSIDDQIPVDDCYGILFPQDSQSCDMVKQLVENDNPKALLEVVDRIAITTFDATKVKQMHPKLAVAILRKFGIPEISVSGKKKFASINEWMKQLKESGVKEETIKIIDGNQKLKLYLEIIVQFVNNNYVVLNSGVIDDFNVEPTSVPSAFKDYLKILPQIPFISAKMDDHNALLSLAATAKVARSLFQQPFGIPYGRMMPLPFVGGSRVNSATLRPIINGLVDDLSHRGKKLRDADKKKIDESLKMLEQLDSMLNELA